MPSVLTIEGPPRRGKLRKKNKGAPKRVIPKKPKSWPVRDAKGRTCREFRSRGGSLRKICLTGESPTGWSIVQR